MRLVIGSSTSTKGEHRAHLKQNNLIAIAFLKKLCRFNVQFQEKFIEFLRLLGLIEVPSVDARNIKDQIRRALRTIRLKEGQLHTNRP
jgi:hypothetical protein